jgi:hypothetical protein
MNQPGASACDGLRMCRCATAKRPFTVSARMGIAAAFGLFAFCSGSSLAQSPQDFGWGDIPAFYMAGDLRAFWNVGDGSKGETAKNAYARGFKPVTILNTYSDFSGGHRENIYKAIGKKNLNPWLKPPFFERTIRRNIERAPPRSEGIYVNDIEFSFEEDTKRAWANEATRRASGSASRDTFDEDYFRQWAEWFSLPLKWTKERYPDARVGLYGAQPFRRDYQGIAGRNAAQIDGTHKSDWRLWKYIDPYADFYVASIYTLYNRPDSVFYMAANVEENYLRTRSLGDKPVYAYVWLRFHDANIALKGKELPSYLVEAMAIVPYFSGAKGVVLWGWEPQVKSGAQQPYGQLPLFVRSLKRVSGLSEKIARGRLLSDQPAHEVWKARGSLIRRVMVDEDECIVMAINPWQGDDEQTTLPIRCGRLSAEMVVDGRHTMLAVLNRHGLQID